MVDIVSMVALYAAIDTMSILSFAFSEILVLNAKELPAIGFITNNREFSFYNSFIPELGQHLQHVLADLLRIIIQTGADDAEAIRRQYPAMQLVGLVLLVLLIFLIRNLLHDDLRFVQHILQT